MLNFLMLHVEVLLEFLVIDFRVVDRREGIDDFLHAANGGKKRGKKRGKEEGKKEENNGGKRKRGGEGSIERRKWGVFRGEMRNNKRRMGKGKWRQGKR